MEMIKLGVKPRVWRFSELDYGTLFIYNDSLWLKVKSSSYDYVPIGSLYTECIIEEDDIVTPIMIDGISYYEI